MRIRNSVGPAVKVGYQSQRVQSQAQVPEAPQEVQIKDSFKVPDVLSKPRSGLSAVNRVFRAADGFGWMENPIPVGFQRTVSGLGAGVAIVNIAGELSDGDYQGAIEDTANGATSLIGGASLLGVSDGTLQAFSLAGATLNAALAMNDFEAGKKVDATIKASQAIGLALRSTGDATANSVGLAILGVSGIATTLGFYLDPVLARRRAYRKSD